MTSSFNLSDEDEQALRESVRKVKQLDPEVLAKHLEGFKEAYKKAQDILDGKTEPL